MKHSKSTPSADALSVGCGLTTDVFYDSNRGDVSVQWLWAAPLDRLAHGQYDEAEVLEALADMARGLGFRPQKKAATHRVLSNGSSHEPACPFACDACPGEHLVVTGAGLLHQQPSMSTAQTLEYLVSNSSLAAVGVPRDRPAQPQEA